MEVTSEQIKAQTDAYLAAGGKVQQVPGFTGMVPPPQKYADPLRSEYGFDLRSKKAKTVTRRKSQ